MGAHRRRKAQIGGRNQAEACSKESGTQAISCRSRFLELTGIGGTVAGLLAGAPAGVFGAINHNTNPWCYGSLDLDGGGRPISMRGTHILSPSLVFPSS